MIDTGLQGRVVLITGGNHGIGAATAQAFAAQGARAFITYLRLGPDDDETEPWQDGAPGRDVYRAAQARHPDAVVEAITQAGGQAEAWEGGLTDPETIPEVFDRAERAFGRVDVLVNNAAHAEADTFTPQATVGSASQDPVVHWRARVDAGSHDHHFAVNSRAVALMMAEYARRHGVRGGQWGRIINVSTDGASGFPGMVSYGASKHALESYSRAAASELGRSGITVNVVSLGPVQTGWVTPEIEQREIPGIPLGRIGRPDDVADVIVFLASDQARWVTGQVLYVGGGHVMPL